MSFSKKDVRGGGKTVPRESLEQITVFEQHTHTWEIIKPGETGLEQVWSAFEFSPVLS